MSKKRFATSRSTPGKVAAPSYSSAPSVGSLRGGSSTRAASGRLRQPSPNLYVLIAGTARRAVGEAGRSSRELGPFECTLVRGRLNKLQPGTPMASYISLWKTPSASGNTQATIMPGCPRRKPELCYDERNGGWGGAGRVCSARNGSERPEARETLRLVARPRSRTCDHETHNTRDSHAPLLSARSPHSSQNGRASKGRASV